MKRSPVALILFIYAMLSILTLAIWERKHTNTVTGDESHYLVMVSGLIKHASLEQTEPYREEFKTRAIYESGLAPQDAEPAPANSHTVIGPHGLFNVHNIGLPLLLSIPVLLGGIVGAKLLMIFCGAFVLVLAWKISALFSANEKHRFWSVIAACISMPFIPASNQIYPDILAGLIALTGLYWFLTTQKKRSKTTELLLTCTIVFLPWLQIKFAATCMLILLAIAAKIYLESRDMQKILRLTLIAGISCVLLVFYNHYAFGKISGPYQSGALEISKTSFMVLLGLHFDQNQGFLIQNPVNLIGVLAIPWLYRFNRQFALMWGLVFLSLIVPNALHPNWYGGWSFSGRFAWAAATVFVVPTMYGLIRFAESREKLFQAVIATSVLLQSYFFYLYAIVSVSLYNKGIDAWFDSYSTFYSPVSYWLPMLYNSAWAHSYLPNYVWLGIVVMLFILGFLKKSRLSAVTPYVAIVFVAGIVTAGLYSQRPSNQVVFKGADLPSQSGRLAGSVRIAEQGTDQPGFLTFGPYVNLGRGRYEIVLRYSSTGAENQTVGSFDIYDTTTATQNRIIPLYGTNDVIKELTVNFESNLFSPHSFEFRNKWDGALDLKIHDLRLRKI
ncbi:hypothetical protein H8L32_00070 [Undibacterium sp. CY18W]|uniref:Glycosyltransferase RgtA/B/C/D-like domain-containing protein n=1 Tax=Undibacterium hunanense TaxID=2762292 RepID=A0ABR6ZJ91_9BURK|nr:hypothetical protein [Undibacterium hunanense]MBC3915864.1 hypothetical protein [Undibacterium hunanense]